MKYYLAGGETWHADPEAAVSFVTEADAEATIYILGSALPSLSPTVHVVSLEKRGRRWPRDRNGKKRPRTSGNKIPGASREQNTRREIVIADKRPRAHGFVMME
jgi:hypothetical protein